MKKTLLLLISIVIVSLIFGRNLSIQKSLASNVTPKSVLAKNKKISASLITSKNVATDLFRGTFDATSKTNRLAIAKDLLNQINLLDKKIATPTPNEINWINLEDKATKNDLFSTRRINLIDSAEFQQYKLKNYLSVIITSLQMILSSSNLENEMYWWGNLSSLLIDELTLNNALFTLKLNGKFPSEIGLSRDMCIGTGDRRNDYNTCYHSFGEGILSYILIPYLNNKKMNNP